MKITVFGCGRWGSFIAWYLNKIGHDVTIWGRSDSKKLSDIKTLRKNNNLIFDEKIIITDDTEMAVKSAEIAVISISAQALRSFANDLITYSGEFLNKKTVLCMKGIELSTCSRLSEVVRECFGKNADVSIWVGPGHVQDFVANVPNCMVIDSYSDSTKKLLISEFSSSLIRFYYGTDMIGNEIGAAAKNVMGIAAGVLDGLGCESLKGALMSRGTYEISELMKALGGNPLSAYGLAHLGDYQATLFSQHSNNRKFGENLAKGEAYDKLAEGAPTSHALLMLGKKLGVDLPICSAVSNVILGELSPKQAIDDLFARPLRQEY